MSLSLSFAVTAGNQLLTHHLRAAAAAAFLRSAIPLHGHKLLRWGILGAAD